MALIIVADDLTGACDAGTLFAGKAPVPVTVWPDPPVAAEVAVVDTESRTPAAARTWRDAVGAANLVHCTDSSAVTWSARGERARRLPPEQVAARLAGGIA